jgi:CoA transferase family III
MDRLSAGHLRGVRSLLRVLRVGASDAPGAHRQRVATSVERPLAGIRILDLTRVIAGPVATRSLALLGADVLRLDSPRLPEIPWQHRDTGQGKRSVSVDAATPEGLRLLDGLLRDADVLVTGYRPGAIEELGLMLPPGIVHATVDAWGGDGPWHGRRGFDSIVQAASGTAFLEAASEPDGRPRPGALPVQALDHSSGYLLAAAIVDSLAASVDSGCGARLGVSLARVGALLVAAGQGDRPDATSAAACAAILDDDVVTHDGVTTARPALAEYDDYPWPAHPLGSDVPAWTPTA